MSIERAYEPEWDVEGAKPDANMAARAAFDKCENPNKVNAGVGTIMDENGVLTPKVVATTRTEIAETVEGMGYLSPAGHAPFLELNAKHLVFGEDLLREIGGIKKVVAAQTPGGTAALYVAHRVLSKFPDDSKKKLLLDPGWGNHRTIFQDLDPNPTTYQHEDPETRKYNHAAYLEVLKNHPKDCPVLLQVAGYNDDGSERSEEQWNEIADIVMQKELIPILDFAYNGLVKGFGIDNYAIKEFTQKGIPCFICVSNSKNAGVYSDRLGALYMVNFSDQETENLQSYIPNKIIRPTWSNPPALPALTMADVLGDDEKRQSFIDAVEKDMLEGILNHNREALAEVLDAPWIRNKGGIFLKLIPEGGLSKEQLEFLEGEAVFPLPSSRINVAGLPTDRIEEVAEIFKEALRLG